MRKYNETYDILSGSIGEIFTSDSDSGNIGKAGKTGNENMVSQHDDTRMSSREGTEESITKVHSFKLEVSIVNTISDIAYWQRRTKRDVVEEALRKYIDKTPEEDKRPRKHK